MARLLLLRGATASLADARVKSRLMEANADDVTRLLRHATGTLIHDAAGTGDRDSMLLLIGRGASLESRDEWGGTPLHTAVRGGQALTLEALLQAGAPVDAADSRGLTPLICAVDRNEPAAMVRLLLAHGASPAGTGSDTPLFHAAEAGYEEVAGILIDAGAPVGLLEAILMGDRDAVECHLASGASVDAANASGMIPLAAAAAQGDIASIRTLLNRGARVDPVGDVRSPLLTAIDREQLEAARLLLEAGANANSVIAHQTPLASAVSRNSVPLVKLLLEFGAKPRGECLGVTLVEEAVSQNGPEIVSMLIEAGADANIGAGLYGTPLMAAVRSGNVECARVLLERGALPDLEDNRGKTPLGIAEAEGPPALVELLRQAGATQSKNSQTASPVPVRRIARLQVPLECLFQYRRLFSAQCPQFPAQLERLLAPALATGVIPQDLLREALTDDPEEVLEALQLLDQLCAFSGDAPSPAA
jgi:ankyrin repeat protein